MLAVNTVPLAGDNTYSIPLHTGWNIISNPFERSTNWSAVQTANGLAGNAVIYDWGGTGPIQLSLYSLQRILFQQYNWVNFFKNSL